MLLAGPALGSAAMSQTPLPFAPGERITYSVQVERLGNIGQATMSVGGPVDVRGTPTYLLRSETRAGIGPLKGSQLTQSWLDPVTMRSLRFSEHERRLFSSRNRAVEIYPVEQHWTADNGEFGETLTTLPLDELSFIYFLRSLPSRQDTSYEFNRHFEASRNPITVRVIHGGNITTPIGAFATTLMEMHVRDPLRYRGEGVIRLFLSDDACRIPVRVESTAPGVGSVVLTLESYTATATPTTTAPATGPGAGPACLLAARGRSK